MKKTRKNYPIVSIIGRPNVGKSSVFNRIIGKRVSIVDEISGVTRDRLYSDVSKYEKPFTLIDTGGIVTGDKDFFSMQIKQQADIAITEADVIIFLLDGKEGITPLDVEISKMLRKSGKNIFVAVNKVDSDGAQEIISGDFYSLGYDDIYFVSAAHNRNVTWLVDSVCDKLPQVKTRDEEEELSIAIVGRPNVGKSSFVNKLSNEDRVVVSDIPGTTRDSVDIILKRNNKFYRIIDTAGMKYKRKIKEALDYYSFNRAEKSIKRADVVFLLIDAEQGLTTLELKILEQIKKDGKPCILIINKWDKIEDIHQKDYLQDKVYRLEAYSYIPCVFISALLGRNIHRVFNVLEVICEEAEKRITTGVLNRFFSDIVKKTPPPYRNGRRFKVYYACQVGTNPSSFVISANDKKLVDKSYLRYIENMLRKEFGFEGVPIRIKIKTE
jgi:GTPase